MNKQEALVKLATVRLAINHVLRNRAMQKQARDPDLLRNLEMSPEVNGAVGMPTPQYVKDLGGTMDKSRTMARYEHPENFPWWSVWPFHGPLKETQDRIKRMQKQDPRKIKEEMEAEAQKPAMQNISPLQSPVVALPPRESWTNFGGFPR